MERVPKSDGNTYGHGAAHESVIVLLFEQRLEKVVPLVLVSGILARLEVKRFRYARGEVDQCVRQVAAVQRFVAAVDSKGENLLTIYSANLTEQEVRDVLGVSLLEQRTPELVAALRMGVYQASVDGGQQVVDDHVDPFSEAPEAEVEYSDVDFRMPQIPFLFLVVRYHLQDTTVRITLLRITLLLLLLLEFTLFHSSLTPARTEQAATNQQLPNLP